MRKPIEWPTFGMKKSVPFDASVRAKQFDHAHTTKQEFQFVLDHWAVERFLFRLGCSELLGRFIPKGTTLFLVWRGNRVRPRESRSSSEP